MNHAEFVKMHECNFEPSRFAEWNVGDLRKFVRDVTNPPEDRREAKSIMVAKIYGGEE